MRTHTDIVYTPVQPEINRESRVRAVIEREFRRGQEEGSAQPGADADGAGVGGARVVPDQRGAGNEVGEDGGKEEEAEEGAEDFEEGKAGWRRAGRGGAGLRLGSCVCR